MINIERIAYKDAKYRCTNPSARAWAYYGGRGIEFRYASFEDFLADVGFRPSREHCLDRINNDGHYEKGNVRWTTRSISAINRRTPKHNTSGFRGVTFNKNARKYEASVKSKNGRRVRYLGLFESPMDAALAYDKAVKRVHGIDAPVNFRAEVACGSGAA